MKVTLCLLCIILYTSCTKPIAKINPIAEGIKQQFVSKRFTSSDSLFSIVKKVDSLSNLYNDKEIYALNYLIKGAYFNLSSNYKVALQYINEVANYTKYNSSLDSLQAAAYLIKGDIYNNLANYPESIESTLKAKEIFEKIKSTIGVNNANISLARIYQAKGDIDKAKEILKTQVTILGVISALGVTHTLANIYGEKGEIDSALALDNMAIAKYGNTSYKRLLSPLYNNKALCFNEKKQFDSSLFYFKKSFTLDSLDNNIKNMAANYDDIGSMYSNQKNYEEAKKYFALSLSLSKKVGRKLIELYSYKNLYTLYKNQNDYKNALLYNDTIKQLQQSIDNVTLNSRIEELNLVYETSKKEKQIQAQQITIVKKNGYIIAASIAVLGIILFAINYNRRQKLQQQLALQKQLFEQEQNKIVAIFAAEETERKRISRDLHDNMGAYTSALLANVEQLTHQTGITDISTKMQTNATHILGSLRETIWVLNNKDLTIQEWADGFKNHCFKVLKNFEHINFKATENILTNPKLSATTGLQLHKIVQEAVQNIIKHANATQINFTINSNTNGITIQLQDNGIGFVHNSTMQGNGLDNMQYRAKEIDYTYSITSIPNTGTSITITNIMV